MEDESEIIGPNGQNGSEINARNGHQQLYNSRLSGNNTQSVNKNKGNPSYGQIKKSYDQYGYGQQTSMSGNRNGGLDRGRERTQERELSEGGFQSASPTPQRQSNKMNTALKL